MTFKHVALLAVAAVGAIYVLNKTGTKTPWFPISFNPSSPPPVPSPVGGNPSFNDQGV